MEHFCNYIIIDNNNNNVTVNRSRGVRLLFRRNMLDINKCLVLVESVGNYDDAFLCFAHTNDLILSTCYSVF